MRASLAASTVTPGRTAPDGSFTTPAIDACARAAVVIAKRHVRIAIALADLHISRLPSPPLPERRLLICLRRVGVKNGNADNLTMQIQAMLMAMALGVLQEQAVKP